MRRVLNKATHDRRGLGRMWRLVTIGVVFALAVALVGQANAPVASAQTPEANLEKLDPGLLSLVVPANRFEIDSDGLLVPLAPRLAIADEPTSPEALDQLDALSSWLATDTGSSRPTVDVMIQKSGGEAELRALGATDISQIGQVFAARIPITSIAGVSALDNVIRMSSAGLNEPSNDLARIDVGASELQNPVPGYDGAGVIVGVIDSGIDLMHEDFRNPDGTTRIKALLDLTIPGAHPSGGTAYTEAQINLEILAPGTTVFQRDFDGHGSHVAGSAAGDGSAANASSAPSGTYVGIAPRADLVIVKGGDAGFSNPNIIRGLEFIRDQAALFGQPWVANLSLGGHVGAHDGTSEVEFAIDDLIGSGLPGRAIVVAAGNEGDSDIHAEGTVVESPTDIPISTTATFVVDTTITDTRFDIWYEGGDDFRFGFSSSAILARAELDIFPDGGPPVSGCWDVPGGQNCISVIHTGIDPFNGDRNIHVRLLATGAAALTLGTWSFELQGDSIVEGGVFDAWSNKEEIEFTSLVDGFERVGMPGTAADALTVGAYITRAQFPGEVSGDAAEFSSPGPTRLGNFKPEIIAPGTWIASAKSADAGPFLGPQPPGGLHGAQRGTSMSSPMVAGAVALLLQVDPTLDSEEIRDLLMATAREDDATGGAGSGWDPKTGNGKLDIYAALSLLLVTDATGSTVTLADPEVLADGIATTTVTVTLRDNLGNPVVGSVVELDDVTATATITPVDGTTSGADGVVSFTVSSATPGLVTFTATDSTDGVQVDDTADVTFTTTASDVATLDELSLSGVTLDPVFASDDLEYTADVANDVDSTSLTVETTDSGAEIAVEVNSVPVNAADPIALDVGETVIEIIVTAEDGLASQTYTVTVTRAAPPPPSDDATLSALSLSEGELSPAFDPGTPDYTASVSSEVESVVVTPTANHPEAEATVVGGSPVNLDFGSNIIEVVVTAEDDSTETYTIDVTRAAPPEPDDDSLMALSLSSGALSPAFASETLNYTASVPNGVASLGVTAMSTNSGATVVVDPESPVALVVGVNPAIEVRVTSADTTKGRTYTITVTRAAAPPPPPPAPSPSSLAVTPTLTVVNDDGGSAGAADFTVLLNGDEIAVGAASNGTTGSNQLTLSGPVSLYAVTFSGACDSGGSFTLPSPSPLACAIEADDLPLTTVLSVPLPGAQTLIDESLSFAADSFLADGVRAVQASTAETDPLLTVTVPIAALPGQSSVTVSVVEGNADAARFNPVPGTVFIAGMAFDIQILDAGGNPIESFAAPIELSFLLPDDVDGTAVAAYFWDGDAGAWRSEAGAVVDGRFVVETTHLTVFAVFEFAAGGGVLGALPGSGVSLSAAEGGTLGQFQAAVGSRGATAVFISHEGRLVGYVFNAPTFVNAEFLAVTGGVLNPGQAVLVVLGG